MKYRLRRSPDVQCDFCSEFAGGHNNQFSKRYRGLLESRILHSTNHLRVFPTLGQLTEGHLLIAPLFHSESFSILSAEALDEAERLVASFRRELTASYGASVIAFEHGIRSIEAGGCGISHAHMHVLPYTDDGGITAALSAQFKLQGISRLHDIEATLPAGYSYLFYENNQAQRFVCHVKSIPSQFMRKLTADHMLNPHWDWRERQVEQSLLETVGRFQPNLLIKTQQTVGV